ncbi:MAG: hypothetical protein Q8Q49_04760, partial [bacterium]|nr:hypothetical protein [bacterium]
MGHSFEAKEGEILFPHALRVQKVRMLIAQANREINVMASKSEVFDQMSDRSAVNDLVQQEKINYAAHFLSERKHGFANHHTKNTVLRSLLLASIQNTEHPQIVGIPQYDPSRLHIIFDRKNLSLDELEHEDVLRGHNNGIQAALRLLSDKNIGLLTRI